MSQTAMEDTKPWPPLKKALWDVVTKARINGKYVAAFPFVDELYAAALSALHAKAGVSVEVKELEWVRNGSRYLDAPSVVGPYEIQLGGSAYMFSLGGRYSRETHPTLKAAKAAAQADYEARILSALSTKLQEPVAFDIDEYQQKRYDNGQPEDPTAYPDWKPDEDPASTPPHPLAKFGSPNVAPLGLYRVHWKSGGASLAAIGMMENGDRWIAPTNWVRPATVPSAGEWGEIERLEPIDPDTLAHQPVTAGLEKALEEAAQHLDDEATLAIARSETCSDDMFDEFCDRAEYFKEAASSVRALAALKSEGRNDG